MALAIDKAREFLARCDPNEALNPGDARYVDFDGGHRLRGERNLTWPDELRRNVELAEPEGSSCQLFSGFPGTGKSTELQRLVASFGRPEDGTPTTALFLNSEQWLNRYAPLNISDLLRVLAHFLDQEALRAEGKDPDRTPGYIDRFWAYLTQTDVELKGLEFSADAGIPGADTTLGAKVALELKSNPDFKRRIEEALRFRFQAFAQQARDAIRDASVRIRKARGTKRLVLVVDGIDKIVPARDDDRGIFERAAESVFVEHADWLKLPSCHVVYTFPLWLRFRVAHLGALYHCEPLILPMVKIADRDRVPHAPGYTQLRALLGKRFDLPTVFGDDLDKTLDPLIAASGGYPRDLLRMAREALRMATTSAPIRPDDSAKIIVRLEEDYQRLLLRTDVPLLQAVAREHRPPDGNLDERTTFGRLVERYVILAYRNGEEWFDLHPLVRSARLLAEEPA